MNNDNLSMLIGSEYDSAQRAIYMFNKYKTCNNNKHTNKNNNNKTTTVKYHPYNIYISFMFNLQASYFNKLYLHDRGACCILKIEIQLFLKRTCICSQDNHQTTCTMHCTYTCNIHTRIVPK